MPRTDIAARRVFFLGRGVATTAGRVIGVRGGREAGLVVFFEELRHQSSPGHRLVHSQDGGHLPEVFRGAFAEVVQTLRNEDPFEDALVHFVVRRLVLLRPGEGLVQIKFFVLVVDRRVGDVMEELLHAEERLQRVTLGEEVRDVATVEPEELQGVGMRLFHRLRDVDDEQLLFPVEQQIELGEIGVDQLALHEHHSHVTNQLPVE